MIQNIEVLSVIELYKYTIQYYKVSIQMRTKGGDIFNTHYGERMELANAHKENIFHEFTIVIEQNDEHFLRNFLMKNAFTLGSVSKSDEPERIVLRAAIQGKLSIPLMCLYFQDLGGRFIVNTELGYTVWGTLMAVDSEFFTPHSSINFSDKNCLLYAYQNMKQVVQCMVHTLGFPLAYFMGQAIMHPQYPTVFRTQNYSIFDNAFQPFCAFNFILVIGQHLLTSESFTHDLSGTWAEHMLLHIDHSQFYTDAHFQWIYHILFPCISDDGLLNLRHKEGSFTRNIFQALLDEARRRPTLTMLNYATSSVLPN